MSETAQDKVNRILRDHEGYTGDGKGGDGALPVGDRSTAVKPIVKRDLREALIAPLQDTWDARDVALQAQSDAEDARDLAQQAAGSVQYPVSYGVAQSLTGPQQQQARTNLGLGTAATVDHGTAPGEIPLNSDLPQPYYEVITTSGTWTKPPGFGPDAMVIVEAWGGGGGGAWIATSANARAGGGGGGGYIRQAFKYADVPGSVSCGVGAGGAGGGSAGSSGTPGGSTTFGNLLTAYAGRAGRAGAFPGGGGGGSGGTGSLNNPGWPDGGAGRTVSGSGAGAASNEYPTGPYGGGGGGGSENIVSTLLPGKPDGAPSIFGGGGGAMCARNSSGELLYSTPGTSRYGGSATETAGEAPGGGGSARANSSGDGARGEVRIWIVG